MEEYLFKPLGITEYIWTSYPDGSLETDGGLALCSRDLAKFGQLYLNKGIWNGKQIVSNKWINETNKGRYRFSRKRSYGYYWNEMLFDFKEKKETAIFVPGDGGQFLAVFPSLEMVIVFTAGNYGTDPTPAYWKLINKFVLPAIKDSL